MAGRRSGIACSPISSNTTRRPSQVTCRSAGAWSRLGSPSRRPEFHAHIDPTHLKAAGITAADAGTYFHLSPFTTADKRELPPEQFVELLGALETRFPEKRWVVSGAPTERERRKMESLLARLGRKPWRMFAGELNLVQLAAVIQHSAAHLSGETGTLHLALMAGVPTVSWFWTRPDMRVWMPIGDRHRTVLGTVVAEGKPLHGVATIELVRAVEEVLGKRGLASR